jgi:DNA-binding HxlR family transcriptional regulator
LTELGRELISLLDAILRWSERHAPEILKARELARARRAREAVEQAEQSGAPA